MKYEIDVELTPSVSEFFKKCICATTMGRLALRLEILALYLAAFRAVLRGGTLVDIDENGVVARVRCSRHLNKLHRQCGNTFNPSGTFHEISTTGLDELRKASQIAR